MKPIVDYFKEVRGGEYEALALYARETITVGGVVYTRGWGRLWHITHDRRYGERQLTPEEVAALKKIKVAHAVEMNPLVVEAATAYQRDYLQGNFSDW